MRDMDRRGGVIELQDWPPAIISWLDYDARRGMEISGKAANNCHDTNEAGVYREIAAHHRSLPAE